MNIYLQYAFTSTILFPVIIGLARFSKINKAYYPFMFFIWAGALNEVVSVTMAIYSGNNSFNGNLYALFESMLLLWQFFRWKLFTRNKWLPKLICILLVLGWLTENMFIDMRITFDSYFLIFYSFLVSLMSITLINKLIVTERRKFLRNSAFIICVAFVLFYTMASLGEIFWVYGLDMNSKLSKTMQNMSNIINVFTNLLFALAILWMPTKQKFTLPSL